MLRQSSFVGPLSPAQPMMLPALYTDRYLRLPLGSPSLCLDAAPYLLVVPEYEERSTLQYELTASGTTNRYFCGGTRSNSLHIWESSGNLVDEFGTSK